MLCIYIYKYQIFAMCNMFSNIKYSTTCFPVSNILYICIVDTSDKTFFKLHEYKIFSNIQQYKYLQYIYMLFLKHPICSLMIICKQPYYAFYTHIYIYTYSVLIYTYITLSIINKSHIINTFETMALCHYTEAF